ncbi:MAG TPA: C25 family cysteine peptidase, partial [Blastocatellia bacterium]|nr:C25 family cysteine peptidase [Blastocatellia bacterium]
SSQTQGGPALYNNLTINNAAGVVLGGNTTVNGTLTLAAGALSVGSNTLTLNGAAASTGGSLTSATNGSVIYNQSSDGQNVLVGHYGNLTFSDFQKVLATGGNIEIGGTFSPGTAGGHTFSGSVIEYNGPGAQTAPAGFPSYGNLTVNNGGLTLAGNISVNAVLRLTNGRVTTNANILSLGASGSVIRTNGYINGNHRKFMTSPGSFTFHVGTTNGYSPVDANVTNATLFGSLTVKAVQGPQPNLGSPELALFRYWTLTGASITATLTFNYLQSDVPPTTDETKFVVLKYDGTFSQPPNQSINTTTNRATVTGVSSFSDWTLGEKDAPTLVDLISFNAITTDRGTLLEWQTGLEADNLGFNIYREEDGKRTLVNGQLIAGSALTAGSSMLSGQSYSWWDSSVANCGLRIADCRNSAYWLEDVDLGGLSTWHGPFYAQPSAGNAQAPVQTARTLAALHALEGRSTPVEFRASQRPSNSTSLGNLQSVIADSPGSLKLQVKREAWYQISGQQLFAAGLPSVDPRNLQLFVDGKQQPITLIGQDDGRLDSTDSLEFYGTGIDSPFTELRTYYLVAAKQPGLRIPTLDRSAHRTSGGSFEFSVERRDRSIYFAGLRNGDRENFFGAVVASQPVNQTLTLNHLFPSASSATLNVGLQGVTAVQHLVSVSLNGTNVGQLSFQGQALGETTIPVPSSLLTEGDNEITLTTEGGASDVSLVDHVGITYQHSLIADDNLLKFSAAPGQQLTVKDFSSAEIRVFDVTDPYSVEEIAGHISKDELGAFEVSLIAPDSKGTRSLLVLTSEKVSAAVHIERDHPSSLRNAAQGADLLIISPGVLFDSLQALKELRQRQGLAVSLVDIEDIYDEFSFGQKSPNAVRDFLAFANSNWKRKPRFVLFAGDASYDPKNYLGLGSGDLVPTKLIDTSFMETASDDWFADFDRDGVADLAIGRLPVRSPEETDLLVSKIIAYEHSLPSREVVLATDQNDGYDFEASTSQLAALLPTSLTVTQINRGRIGTEAAKKNLLDSIYRGQKIVNYVGHGSVDQWRAGLLTSDDALALENKRLPVFVLMTCLNGFFTEPGRDSLAEALIRAEHGGAVAVWASSGMTLPSAQASMNQEFFRLLFSPKSGLTLGEAAARAKRIVTDVDVRRTWILLGDPAMKVR